MSQITLTHIVQRSAAGQALLWGAGALPDTHERVLMRLTGYTPLVRLSDPDHDPQWLLAVVEALLDEGLAEVVDVAPDEGHCSSWGELALSLAH